MLCVIVTDKAGVQAILLVIPRCVSHLNTTGKESRQALKQHENRKRNLFHLHDM